ncbi:MAG: hypothetical protein KJO40_19585 [Deltaproteobacteria bacterium]|nr:hypothetical protein [Deltaproteobacteria bacterium]
MAQAPPVTNIREELGFSKSEWARILGVTDRTVYRWDEGKDPSGMAFAVLSAIRLAVKECGAAHVRARLIFGIGPLILEALEARK